MSRCNYVLYIIFLYVNRPATAQPFNQNHLGRFSKKNLLIISRDRNVEQFTNKRERESERTEMTQMRREDDGMIELRKTPGS